MRSRVTLVGVTFHDVEAALNTIPLTSIGITAFAAFTTVLILRRLNVTSALLYLSAFSSLAASILDLGQLIFKVSDDKGHVTLINAREVGFALSYGFSYLFYWLLVARCPRGESVFENQDHSASWTRWGLVGLILKWGLLALILADFILQIIWRVSPQGVKSGTVYITESTIQIIVSAILVLKLLLNMLISPLASLWSRLSSNIVPLIGLGLSAALAIANLITRAFSETTLGRFFRAVELYLLIVFAVIFSLKGSERRRLSDSLSSPKIDEKFIDPRATAYQNPIGVLVRRRSSIIGERLRRPSQRASTLSRIMSKATQKYETSRDGDTLFTTTPANGSSDSNEGKDMHSFLPNAKSSDFVPPRPIGGRPTTNTSIPSYYGMVRNSAASLTRDTISPIYGLNGIAPPQSKPPRPRSETPIDELIREQDELDQSIAALKFISRQADSSPELAQVMLASKMPEKLNRGSILDRVPASITGPRIESNRSEFSLSVFPEPPNRSVLEVAPAGRQKVVLPETSGNLKVLDSATPNYIGQYNPNGRFGSTGTAYDVTSFIGGLTIESGGGPMSAAAPSSGVANTLGRIAEMPELGSRRASPELPSRSARRESQPLLFRPVKFRGKDGVQKMISQPQRLSSKETPGAFEQPRRPPIVG